MSEATKERKELGASIVRRYRCQFLRDNGEPCGRIAMRHKVRVFLDSTCGHGRGWCEVYACEDHAKGRYVEPNVASEGRRSEA